MHALTLITGAMKEYVFYIATGVDIASLHAGVRDSVSSHEVQCIAVQEPVWSRIASSFRDVGRTVRHGPPHKPLQRRAADKSEWTEHRLAARG